VNSARIRLSAPAAVARQCSGVISTAPSHASRWGKAGSVGSDSVSVANRRVRAWPAPVGYGRCWMRCRAVDRLFNGETQLARVPYWREWVRSQAGGLRQPAHGSGEDHGSTVAPRFDKPGPDLIADRLGRPGSLGSNRGPVTRAGLPSLACPGIGRTRHPRAPGRQVRPRRFASCPPFQGQSLGTQRPPFRGWTRARPTSGARSVTARERRQSTHTAPSSRTMETRPCIRDRIVTRPAAAPSTRSTREPSRHSRPSSCHRPHPLGQSRHCSSEIESPDANAIRIEPGV